MSFIFCRLLQQTVDDLSGKAGSFVGFSPFKAKYILPSSYRLLKQTAKEY